MYIFILPPEIAFKAASGQLNREAKRTDSLSLVSA